MTDTFHCEALKCRLTPKACVARQDVRRSSGGSRGQRPSSHRMCDPELCAVGKRMRVVVEEAQRDAAGIPLAALDEVDELDLDDALEQLDVGAPALARALDEDREDTARDLYEPDVSQARPVDDLTKPDPGEREPAQAQEDEPVSKGEKKCACGATIRKDSTKTKCLACRQAEKGEARKCSGCGTPIRRDSADGQCTACRKITRKPDPAPKKTAAAAPAKPASLATTPELHQLVAALSNEDLAGLIELARGLARERLRGADVLQRALT